MDTHLDPTPAKGRELIAFHVGGQEFCVDIACVRELRGWTQETPLPQAPSYMRGVINLRGAVLPIVDMAVRLGLEAQEPTSRHVILVVWIGKQLVGLLVDAVSDILTIGEAALQPTPEMACDTVHAFVSRLLSVEDRMIGLVALDHVLPPAEAQAA